MKKILKWGLIGFGGLILLGIIISGSGGSSEKSMNGGEDKTQKQAEEIKSQEAISVDVSDFISEYDNNQLAAEEKYKGKPVKLTAYVDNISEDILGSPFISLKPTNTEYYFDTSIQCYFKDKNELMSLKNDQQVTVQGIADTQDLGIIGIKDCTIAE